MKQAIAFTRTHQEPQQQIIVTRTKIEWSGTIEYLGMVLDNRPTLSKYLKGARTSAIGRICQLYPLLSSLVLNPKTGIMLYKLRIRPTLTYSPPHMGHGTTQPHHIGRESTKSLFATSTPRPSQNDAGRAESSTRRRRPRGVSKQAESGFLRENLR
ncbi:hypothetical protein Trydic_g5980 [Trypoxylus dichotomus]